jgi:hypothetical protein
MRRRRVVVVGVGVVVAAAVGHAVNSGGGVDDGLRYSCSTETEGAAEAIIGFDPESCVPMP